MHISNIDHLLYYLLSHFRAQYTEGAINTLVKHVRLATATTGGNNPAALVEQCRCPRGYTGLSCEVISIKYNAGYLLFSCFVHNITKLLEF